MWKQIVRQIGGVHEIGRLTIVIHDRGAYVAWDQVVQLEWNRRG